MIIWENVKILKEKQSKQNNSNLPKWQKKQRFFQHWNKREISKSKIVYMQLDITIWTIEIRWDSWPLTELTLKIIHGHTKKHAMVQNLKNLLDKRTLYMILIYSNIWERPTEVLEDPAEPLALVWILQEEPWEALPKTKHNKWVPWELPVCKTPSYHWTRDTSAPSQLNGTQIITSQLF